MLRTDALSLDLPAECWAAAAEIVPTGSAFTEEFWNAMSRQMLTGLILHIVATYPAEKRTVESLIELVDGGVKSVAAIRANAPCGAVRALLYPSEAEKDEHYTAAILAECAANLHRFMLSKSPAAR